jgi:hypothetical protein
LDKPRFTKVNNYGRWGDAMGERPDLRDFIYGANAGLSRPNCRCSIGAQSVLNWVGGSVWLSPLMRRGIPVSAAELSKEEVILTALGAYFRPAKTKFRRLK